MRCMELDKAVASLIFRLLERVHMLRLCGHGCEEGFLSNLRTGT
jgi:hypothetical protein